MSTLQQITPHLKAIHVGFMAIWMAGLVALPAMIARHERTIEQADFHRIRHATHYCYVWAITPAAALVIGSGLALMLLREVFTLWMFAKLGLVAGLVGLHAWVGHTIITVAETAGSHEPPRPWIPILMLCATATGVLFLVLAKPDLSDVPMPHWLLQPVGGVLPFDVPNP